MEASEGRLNATASLGLDQAEMLSPARECLQFSSKIS